jgi:hypothetical protein
MLSGAPVKMAASGPRVLDAVRPASAEQQLTYLRNSFEINVFGLFNTQCGAPVA